MKAVGSPRFPLPAVTVGVFACALSLYLLTYSGLMSELDQFALYAVAERRAQTLTLELYPTALGLRWTSSESFFGRFEPGFTFFLMPVLAAVSSIPWLGNVQVALLVNLVTSAATVALVYWGLETQGYRRGTSLASAAILAAATSWWPYSKTLLREPLAGLAVLGAFLAANRAVRDRRWRWPVLAAGFAAVGIATKAVTGVTLLPLMAVLAVLWVLASDGRSRLIGLAVTVGLLVGAALLTSSVRGGGPSLLLSTAESRLLRGGDEVWRRLPGILASPGKGLFVTSPGTLIGVVGAGILSLRRPALGWIPLFSLLSAVWIYAHGPVWSGGPVWGVRTLVPFLPLLGFAAAELIERSGRLLRAAVMAISLAGVIVSLAAATNGIDTYYTELSNRFGLYPEDTVLMSWSQWPLSTALHQVVDWSPSKSTVAWARPTMDGIRLYPGVAAVALLPALASLAVLRFGFTAPRHIPPLAAFLLTSLVLFAALVYRADGPFTFRGWEPEVQDPSAMKQAFRAINADPLQPRLIASVSRYHPSYYQAFNYAKGQYRHLWYSPSQIADFDDLLSPPAGTDRLYVIMDHIPPQSDHARLPRWLTLRLHPYSVRWFGPYLLYEYAYPRPMESRQVTGASWINGIRLESASVEPRVSGGDVLRLRLDYRSPGPLPESWKVFVHLVGPDGRVIIGHDSEPVLGDWPTTLWRTGQVIRDRRGILIPPDTPAGTYSIRMGFYRDEERLPLTDGATFVTLGTVEIVDGGTRDPSRVVAPPAYERAFQVPDSCTPVKADFGDFARLEGFSLERTRLRPGDDVLLTLCWRAQGPTATDWTVFAHLVRFGEVIAGRDSYPAREDRPTSTWQPGEVVLDHRELSVPADTAPGPLAIELGLYAHNPGTGKLDPPQGDGASSFRLPALLEVVSGGE